MPRISSFFGIAIEMYFGDHPPPHFHARHGEEMAKVEIATGALSPALFPNGRSDSCENGLSSIAMISSQLGAGCQQRSAKADRTTAMSKIISVTDVEPLEGLQIRATFSNGAVKDIDLSELIDKGGVFAPIRDRREIFEQVSVNPKSHTVEWPGEVDLDPDVLYGGFEPASGARLKRRTIREPIHAVH